MRRIAYQELLAWKNNDNRKPLIIRGARQVGKTWLMKEFAKEYKNLIYVNFEDSTILQQLFVKDFNIDRILMSFQIESGIKAEPGNTLIILDEIQEAKRGLTSLKYFQENAPEYHIIAAGSYLGISMQENTSFPVGKVNFLDLYPMSFYEFLIANGEENLYNVLQQKQWDVITQFKSKYIELLKLYYYIGGMPEVVNDYISNKDFNSTRIIQNQLLIAYEQDFAKHAPRNTIPRIRLVWNSLPTQLSKENRKFVFGLIKKGARAKDFEMAIEWLKDSGLVYQINRISKPGLPLASYKDPSAYKLFMLDIGLLGAMAKLEAKVLTNGSQIFEEFKGALTENYVLQQLINNKQLDIYYWSAEKSSGEIDFIIQHKSNIFPLEVKSEENLKAKSLRAFKDKYQIPLSYRTSMANYRKEEWLENIPLFAIRNNFGD
jgi:predicted AAA+ superfamily ATPase